MSLNFIWLLLRSVLLKAKRMGHQSSKSSMEARVVLQAAASASVLRGGRKAASQSSVRSCDSPPPPRHSKPHCWSQSRGDGGLVYVMDNPTGGVWVRPRETWTRS